MPGTFEMGKKIARAMLGRAQAVVLKGNSEASDCNASLEQSMMEGDGES